MKTINLYFDFEFTSLSPDAQPISFGIVSDSVVIKLSGFSSEELKFKNTEPVAKSFYAEFSDFDINRCDDWVKEHVVGKLQYFNKPEKRDFFIHEESFVSFIANSHKIRRKLMLWLTIFRDYKIQFVCDCGIYDWYWMVQLLAEWETKFTNQEEDGYFENVKTGLPKLPQNISPVPFDLNDLIAIKKGITPAEAFDIERLGSFCQNNPELYNQVPQTHNALFDAKVIKESYHSLK